MEKWTAEDNAIAEVEMRLSQYLTAELTSRPEISLNVLFASKVIQAHIMPILHDLEERTGHLLCAYPVEHRTGRNRKVFVDIQRR